MPKHLDDLTSATVLESGDKLLVHQDGISKQADVDLIATKANLDAHVDDTVDAHDASAISATPDSDAELVGDTVQEQLVEIGTRTTRNSIFDEAADAITIIEFFPNSDVATSGVHGTHNWTHNVANSGDVNVVNGSLVAAIGGGRILRTLTSTTSHAAIGLGAQALIKGSPVFVYEWVVKLSALSDGTNTYTTDIGMFNALSSAAISSGVYFEHRNGQTNWRLFCKNNTATTEADSGVAVTTSEFRFRVVSDGGSSMTFFINNMDTAVGSITTNLPDSNRTTGPAARMTRTAGTTERDVTLHRFVGRFETTRTAP
jgi:hypothetical protein